MLWFGVLLLPGLADAACGDGIVETAAERCDDGNAQTEPCAYGLSFCEVCDATCRVRSGAVSFCGDGIVDRDAGEHCDDGGAVGGCPAACGRFRAATVGDIEGVRTTLRMTTLVLSFVLLCFRGVRLFSPHRVG